MSCVSDPTPYAGRCVGTVGVPTLWKSIHTGLRAPATRRQVPSCESAALLWVFVHLGKHLHVRVSAAAFSHAHGSLCAWWVGLLHGSEHWPIIGTPVARGSFQPSRKAFMCGSRAAANPSQCCTKAHSYFWGCSSTIGSHANLGSARACAQCCHGRVGDRNEFIVHAMTSINLRIIMLSDRSQ